MAEKPTKGTVVSFGNTPQAKDDQLTGLGTEDSSGIIYLNVMANDLGGNGKSLWATDDGISEGGDRPVDLLEKDSVGAIGASALGAQLWITSDGKVAYQLTSALRDSFQSLSVGQSVTDSFTYAIQLGNGTLSWAKVNMTLAGTNDVPVVQNVSIAALEDGPPVTGAFIGDDIDSDDDAASIQYSLGTLPAIGTLTNNNNGTFTYNSDGKFQQLAAGEPATLGFTYTAKDKHGAVSAPANGTITVTGVNDAPTLKAGASELKEDGATVTVNLAALADDIDNDDDGSTLQYAVLGSVPGGSATISGTTLSLSPGTDFQELALNQPANFAVTIEAKDKHGATATNAIAVTVIGANDAPTLASGGTIAVIEDGAAATLDLATLGNDVDSDNDGTNLKYTLLTTPAQGNAVITGTVLSFDPGADYQQLAQNQPASVLVNVQATDKHGASVVNQVKLQVTGVNDAPEITSGPAAAAGNVKEDTVLAATGQLSASDVDLADKLSWSVAGAATSSYGTLKVDANNGKWDYSLAGNTTVQTLAAGQSVVDTFTVRVSDGMGGSDEQTVTVTVDGTNDAPTLQAGTLKASEDGAPVTLNLATLGDDIDSDDDGASLTYALQGAVPGASLSGTNLGFDPGTGFQGLAQGETQTITLTVEARDKHGATTVGTVNVLVAGTNDAPTLASGALSATEDGGNVALNLATLGNDIDSDNDGGNLVYTLLGAAPQGSATISGTTLNFNPGTGFQALAADQKQVFDLGLRATDKHGVSSDNVVKVTVTGVNDAPTIAAGSDASGSVSASPTVAPFTVRQYNNYLSDNFALANLQAHAAANNPSFIATTSIIDYTDDPAGFAGEIPGSTPWPAAAQSGVSGTSHALNDNFFARITGQVTITAADTYTFRTYNDDGVYLHVNNQLIISDGGIHPEAAFNGTIQLNPGVYPIDLWYFENGGEASLEFSFKGSSGSFGHVTSGTLADSGVVKFDDVDLADAHTITVAPVGTTLGSLTAAMTKDTTGGGTGEVKWDYKASNDAAKYLGAGESTTDSFTITVNDNKGGTVQQTVAVVVNGVNDNPVITTTTNEAKGNVMEDTTLTVSNQIKVSDVDANDTHTWSVNGPATSKYGTMSVDNSGTWTYTLANGSADVQGLLQGQTVTDTFTIRASDGKGGHADQTVHIVVAGVADGPTANDDSNALSASTVVASSSNVVNWVKWTSVTETGPRVGSDAPVRVEGSITLGNGETIGVTYEGMAFIVQADGTKYVYQGGNLNDNQWTQPNAANLAYTANPAVVSNAPTPLNMIGLNEAFTGGGFLSANPSRTDYSPRNLTFSEPVDNLFFAVLSMNSNGYIFDQNFTIVSQGQGYYGSIEPEIAPTSLGSGRYGIVANPTPQDGSPEFHGVLRIDGSVDHLTWNSQDKETWNGFTVGTYGKSQTASASGNVLANDVKGQPAATLEVSEVGGSAMVGSSVTLTLASGATLKVDRDGQYFYDDKGKFVGLKAGESHVENVVYTVRDSQGYTDTATLTITVNGVNDKPVATADSATTNEDAPISINVLANDSDPDGDVLTLLSATHGSKGTVQVVGNNAVYTPQANFAGTDSFSYTVKDALGATSTATVAVTVNNVVDTYTPVNLVKNGSFEAISNGFVSVGTLVGNWTLPNDWTMTGNGVDVVTAPGWQAADGSRSLDLNAFSPGGVQQLVATASGINHYVSFMLSKNPGSGGQTYTDTVRVTAGDYSADHSFNLPNTNTDMMWQQKSFSFSPSGSSTMLSFSSLTPQGSGNGDVREGPALDEVVVVSPQIISGFTKGLGGDVLNLSGILSSIGAPHDASAFSGGFLRFELTDSGNGTIVSIDPNGGGDHYLPIVALVGTGLLQSDTGNYLL